MCRSSLRILYFSLILTLVFQSLPLTRTSADFTSRAFPGAGRTPARQQATLRIRERNPVVNETKQLTLTAVDASDQPLTGVTWESGSPDIASVDPQTGVVRGVKQGFATVTARRDGESFSTFVVVARVRNGNGAKVPGDTKTDTGGRIYISDPTGSVILRKGSFAESASIFAGQRGETGVADGQRLSARFNAPTAVTVDNSARGGVYVADTANHKIRKIDFNDQVTTILGSNSPGMMTADVTPLDRATFRGPRGVVADTGGNLFITDTENHAVYYADLARREVRLLAGEPGTPGKADGRGRAARFTRPRGGALSTDGRILAIADEGNNVVRLISRDGQVATLGRASSAKGSPIFEPHLGTQILKNPAFEPGTQFLKQAQPGDDITFNAPQSVSIDAAGNIYVVDQDGAFVVTRPNNQLPEVVQLAQDGSFEQAASVVVRGTESFVLDTEATTEAEAVKVVTVGAPEIQNLSPNQVQLEGGEEVTITGKNFAPESRIIIGDAEVTDFDVESATQIRVRVPKQNIPGNRNLTIQTRGGVDQERILTVSKRFDELADGEITTVAGGIPYVGDGDLATGPTVGLRGNDLTLDVAGNIYVSDYFNARVRRIDANTGVITTVAGNGRFTFVGDGGLAVSAGVGPTSATFDGEGNLYVVDLINNRLRKIDPRTGIIQTIAGNGGFGFSPDGIPATQASLGIVYGATAVIDPQGNVVFSDPSSNRVRRINSQTGIISTLTGNGTPGFSGDGGPATGAVLFAPHGIVFDQDGNLFINDAGNQRIRRIDARTGVITTIAGNGARGFSGDGGPATSASFNLERGGGMAFDPAGNLYIADGLNFRVRRIDRQSNIITTVAGSGNPAFGGDSGLATSAGMEPTGVAFDGSGNLLISDFTNRIRRVDAQTRIITTIAGTGKTKFGGDGGLATNAGLSFLGGFSLDSQNNLYISDEPFHYIHRVDGRTGIINIIAGTGNPGSHGDGGLATSAGLSSPRGQALDGQGNLYFADTFNNRIRRINLQTGIITTVAGNGNESFGGDGGPATSAALFNPSGVAFDRNGNFYIADTGNHRVRMVEASSGRISTVAGTGVRNFTGDGGPARSATLNLPQSVAFDPNGNLLICDAGSRVIRRVNAQTGIISTIAGKPGDERFSGDGGLATQAGVAPAFVTSDAAGNLYIADYINHRIRRIDAQTGIISTIAGTGREAYTGDGEPASTASLNNPYALVIDQAGNIFLADRENKAIRVIKNGANYEPPPAGSPTLALIEDRTVRAGDLHVVEVRAFDPNGTGGLRLNLLESPDFVALIDNGNGVGELRIAPPATATQGGRVTVQVVDPTGLSAQTSFTVTVLGADEAEPTVSNVTLSRKKVVRKKDATLGISWRSADDTGVMSHDLRFAADGSTFDTVVISGLDGSTQNFVWTIPASVPKTKTGRVLIIARDAAGNTGVGTSQEITIK